MSIPNTMRAAVLRSTITGLNVEEIRTPEPRADEVLIKVSACGLCHSDLHVISGAIQFPLPAVLGHEISGEIVALGSGAEHYNLKLGQHVSGAFLMPCGKCPACAAGRDDLCSPFFNLNRLAGKLYDNETRLFDLTGNPIAMYSMGGLAEYAVVPATSVAVLPAEIELVESAILGCAALTAYGAVRRAADLRFGQTVAVVATGGVGSNIIQLAKGFGARQVIALDINDEKLAAAKNLGADHVINVTTSKVADEINRITNGRGVDIAFEALGRPETWSIALETLRDGGKMVPIGLGAGVQSAPVEINRLVRRSQQIIGSYGALTRQDLPRVIRLAAEGIIDYHQVVTRHVSLEAAGETYAALRRGEIQGRAVVDMSL